MEKIDKKPYFVIGKWEVFKEGQPKVFIPYSQKTYQFIPNLEQAQEMLKEARENNKEYVLEEFVYCEEMKCSVPKRLIKQGELY